MEDCLFCKLVQGTVPSKKLYEDDDILAFHDIRPIAPVQFGNDVLRSQSVVGKHDHAVEPKISRFANQVQPVTILRRQDGFGSFFAYFFEDCVLALGK